MTLEETNEKIHEPCNKCLKISCKGCEHKEKIERFDKVMRDLKRDFRP